MTAQFGYNLYNMPVLKNLTMHDYRLLCVSDSVERPYFFGLGMPSRFNCNRGFPVKETPVAPEPAEQLDASSIIGAPEHAVSVKVPGAHGTRVLKAGRLLGSGRIPKGSSSRRALKQAEKSGLASVLSIDGAQSL